MLLIMLSENFYFIINNIYANRKFILKKNKLFLYLISTTLFSCFMENRCYKNHYIKFLVFKFLSFFYYCL